MLCVTGFEPTAVELRARLERVRGRLGNGALQEVRLDALDPIGPEVFDLIGAFGDRLVVCCRPVAQGGGWDGGEAGRREVLEEAARLGAAYVDVEHPDAAGLGEAVRNRGRSKVILSKHDFLGVPPDLSAVAAKMAEAGADLVKVAVRVEDAADLEALKAAADAFGGEAVWIGMGPAGLLSRARYPFFRSSWTYVAAEAARSTAPGQLTLDEALAMGLPGSAREPFIALVGGANVAHSPGRRVYNRLFRALDLPWAYLPVVTRRAPDVFRLLRRMGALGAAVTMPHKRAALEHSEPDAAAREAGAANTLRFDGDATRSTNTDTEGVRGPLAEALAGTPSGPGAALILGAGGAARAAIAACRSLGLRAVIAARDPERASSELGAGLEVVPWDGRTGVSAAILINATPRESAAGCPWPEKAPLRMKVVFDLALGPGRSLLLERAREEGAIAIPAEAMWVLQGARQMEWITGLSVSTDRLLEWMA